MRRGGDTVLSSNSTTHELWPLWANQMTCLSLSFLICTVGTTTAALHDMHLVCVCVLLS